MMITMITLLVVGCGLHTVAMCCFIHRWNNLINVINKVIEENNITVTVKEKK